MTATVSFLTGSATNALLVPNAALRFRATPEMMAEAGLKPRSATGNSTTTKGAATSGAAANGGANGAATNGGANGGQRSGANGARGGSGGARPSVGMLWYLDKTGKLAVARVKTGLTDGQTTEVIPRDSTTVQAGQQVITGATVASTSSSTSSASANPLQPQSGGRRGPGGF
jgi:HlyD family secretion protein